MTRYFFVLFAVLICLFPAVAQTGKRSGKQQHPVTIFTLDKHPVYADEFMYLYKKNNGKTENTDAKIQEYLDLFINFKLKVNEAYHRRMDTTAAFKSELKTYREELMRPYRADADDLNRLTREVYDRLSEEVRASHILVNVAADATPEDTLNAFTRIQAIRARLMAGEDFEKVARETSEDPSARLNGGSLGYFTAMQMVFPFEDAAYKLGVGELSMPVRTRFGYHLIKVNDRRPARGEVEVSHILIRKKNPDDKKSRDTAFEIFDQLKGGRAWPELVKEFSEDPGTKDTGGRLPAFGVGALASVPEFEATAFSLSQPGEISDPFQSAVGWHIIRLERKIPLLTYQEMEPALKRKVARDERVEISKIKNINLRKKQFGFTGEASGNQILSMADSAMSHGHWKYKGGEALKKSVLFKLEGRSFLTEDFISYVVKNQKPSELVPADQMKALYDKFTEETLDDAEDAKLQAEHPEYKNLLNEYREGILLFSLMEKEVWSKAAEDTAGQRKFYNENIARYKAGERVEARIFATADRAFLTEIRNRITQGDTLREADMKKFTSVQRLRNYEKGDSKVMDKVSASIGLHEVELDGVYYLVDVNKLVLPGSKSLEEARASVISDYQDSLEKIWLTQLKKKYPVKINAKGKKLVFAGLKKGDVIQFQEMP